MINLATQIWVSTRIWEDWPLGIYVSYLNSKITSFLSHLQKSWGPSKEGRGGPLAVGWLVASIAMLRSFEICADKRWQSSATIAFSTFRQCAKPSGFVRSIHISVGLGRLIWEWHSEYPVATMTILGNGLDKDHNRVKGLLQMVYTGDSDVNLIPGAHIVKM